MKKLYWKRLIAGIGAVAMLAGNVADLMPQVVYAAEEAVSEENTEVETAADPDTAGSPETTDTVSEAEAFEKDTDADPDTAESPEATDTFSETETDETTEASDPTESPVEQPAEEQPAEEQPAEEQENASREIVLTARAVSAEERLDGLVIELAEETKNLSELAPAYEGYTFAGATLENETAIAAVKKRFLFKRRSDQLDRYRRK